ncbi:MAG: hypothetical protein K2X86_15520 [Cytophagaceae bacterium]|nr:hypothetical protein [Cytophagaceae bacterium]
MKVLKTIILILWVVLTTIFILGALTPLEFVSPVLMYASFLVTFNGLFALRFLLTDFISLKLSKVFLSLTVSLAIAFTYAFLPKLNNEWKTQEILYRHKSYSQDVIAFQMESLGQGYDHRTVKIEKFTPIFNYVTELKNAEATAAAGNDWIKVNEYINELGLQK